MSIGKKLAFMSGIVGICVILHMNNAFSEKKNIYNYNNIHHVYLPPDYPLVSAKRIQFKQNDIFITLYARDFAQGNALYLEIKKTWKYRDQPLEVKSFLFEKKYYPLKKTEWGYRGLGAIHPASRPGRKRILVAYSIGSQEKVAQLTVKIHKNKYKIYKSLMQVGKFSNVTYYQKYVTFIQECQAKKNRAFSTKNPDFLGPARSHPRTVHMITSPFWSQRKYFRFTLKRGKKVNLPSSLHIHRGLDLYGKTGDHVYSIADGKVVLAEKLFYEGNMIVIDHGNRIYSYFMHLSKLRVKKGERVCAGELIGLVGSTGVSTASHLHVSFIIRGTQVDPLSILPLPIRN